MIDLEVFNFLLKTQFGFEERSLGVNFINILRARFFCQNPFAIKSQSQNVTREKLPEALSYENRSCKMLMKLTKGTSVLGLLQQKNKSSHFHSSYQILRSLFKSWI